MKFILFANTDWYLYNFRLSTARALQARGVEVVMVSPPGDFGPRFAQHGVRWVPLRMQRASLNPLREAGTMAALVALLREDVRITMPPHPWLFEGLQAVRELMVNAEGTGEWRLLPTRANRMPTAASYLRRPGDTEFRAFKLDVLRVEDGRITYPPPGS